MERTTSVFLTLFFLIILPLTAYAESPHQNAIYELYSVDGFYEDDVSNRESYSYHIRQINADTSAAVSKLYSNKTRCACPGELYRPYTAVPVNW